MMRRIPYERLRKVWMNRRFTTDEVAAILLITEAELRRLAKMHRLPHRHFVQRNEDVNDEPTQEERLEQLRRMDECRQAHLEQRRAEPIESTQSKVSKWRAGICQPREGSHTV